jgi:hypothetical protein
MLRVVSCGDYTAGKGWQSVLLRARLGYKEKQFSLYPLSHPSNILTFDSGKRI